MAGRISLNRRFSALLFVASLLSLSTTWLWLSPPSFIPVSMGLGRGSGHPLPHGYRPTGAHPIDTLIHNANLEWHSLMTKETLGLADTAEAYRKRRGRHPPPGFDKWYEFAKTRNAVLIEDFFDQIYTDMAPFWGMPAEEIRRAAKTFDFVVSVRNGSTTQKSDGKDRPWMGLWEDLVASIVKQTYVPDLDMAVNVMDESRIVVPFEDMSVYMAKETESRVLTRTDDVLSSFSGLSSLDETPDASFEIEFTGKGAYWDLARVGCPPDSAFRTTEFTDDFTGPPKFPEGQPPGSFRGYVVNWTMVKDPCHQPDLQSAHGTFIEPLSKSTTHKLFPMFGGSKLPMNNEILIPPAMYWSDNDRYVGGSTHGGPWAEKENGVVWRGAATGGRSHPESWTRFQRHRLINMLNGSAAGIADETNSAPTFRPDDYRAYPLESTRQQKLGEWVGSFSNVGFYDLNCYPRPQPPDDPNKCSYLDHFYSLVGQIPMKDQYNYKYLPDVDGNSFSGRYWAFLWSTSLPIKATIYNEWHDSRLIPWLHFVPMHNSFVDLYGILDYFIGNTKCNTASDAEPDAGLRIDSECNRGHDSQAERIALAGKDWAEKVLRREDMQIYVYRLLLEYARICDDQRNRLGFVDDLQGLP